MAKELNWHRKSFFNLGADFCITVKDPKTGESGPGVYQIYGVTDGKFQSSISLSESGLMSIYNDGNLEIHAGSKSQKGVSIQISSSNGDITITAGKNGDVRIKSNGDMTFDCNGKMTISAADLEMKVASSLKLNALSADLNAKTGNMLPEGESFSERCYEDSHVGSSAVRGFNALVNNPLKSLGG
jgi:hypothetical protein